MSGKLQWVFVFALLVLMTPLASGQAQTVQVLTIDSPITPASMQALQSALEKANEERAEALVIRLDTPGGLMESTRNITKDILNSSVPVVVFVAPEGARAGSAGVFISMAAHVAAMAPSTNIGAATPVGMGGAPGGQEADSTAVSSDQEAMRKKVTNDAVAQVRAMAERRGRNADWAEEAVREAASITANTAVEINVVDLLADNLQDLLEKLDGRVVETVDGEVTLITADATIEHIELTWRDRFLMTLANPNLAYILLMIGMYGLIFELYNPGAIIPGVLGVIALILAFFAMQTLPVNWAGLILIVVGILMFLLEIKVASYGFLTFGGIVSLVIGSIMLFDSPIPQLEVSLGVVIPSVLVTVLFFAFAITLGIRAQKNRVATGNEGLVGEEGVAASVLNPSGKVKIGSEYWNAEAEGETIEKGARVVVVESGRLRLRVRKLA